MPIVDLPPQIKITCDDCHEAMGEEEFGGYAVHDKDKADEALAQYDWHRTAEGQILCPMCQEERTIQREDDEREGP